MDARVCWKGQLQVVKSFAFRLYDFYYDLLFLARALLLPASSLCMKNAIWETF